MIEVRALTGTAHDRQVTTSRLEQEAKALRHVFVLPVDERAAAAARLDAATLELVLTIQAVAQELNTAPGLQLADVVAMLDRPVLRDESKGAREILEVTKGYDPADLKSAYDRVLEDTARAGDLRRIEETERKLAAAKVAETTADRRVLFDGIIQTIERGEQAGDESKNLDKVWDAHRDRLDGERAEPAEAVMLDVARRGDLASWFNSNLGPRGGLDPGRTLLIGGAPGGGKTSMVAALAVDALAVGCPVLFWQLELSREETLEHLFAQYPEPDRWWGEAFWQRSGNPLPASWRDLLTIPSRPMPEVEEIERALLDLARKTERGRRSGQIKHACNGLMIVDYAQLMTVAARGPKDAGHEVLATAASRLAKAAGESGASLVLLSQLTKESQRDGGNAAGTAYHGADLARMAHSAVTISRAYFGEGGKLTVCTSKDGCHVDEKNGEARLLAFTKTRGTFPTWPKPEPTRKAWYWNRALHGGVEEQAEGKGWTT